VCLSKPFRNEELFRAMVSLIDPGASTSIAPPEAPAPSPAEAQAAAAGLHVLVAEDNAVNQRLAVALLTKRGHRTSVVESGHEVLAAMERERFDLILMDLQMPGMGGLEATAAIRARERQRGGHVRIIAMTAHAMPGDREKCLEVGMDDYLTKPIDSRRLFAALDEVVASRSAAEAEADLLTFDRADLLRRLDGDDELMHDVIDLYLQDSPRLVDDIGAAIAANDAKAVRATAHRLKGAAGNLAATKLAEIAYDLELMGERDALVDAPSRWRDLQAEAARVKAALEAERAGKAQPLRTRS
jgi:CheY-like chemotaxis protein/HPt (histidine-containing phosphotransfer) domain-containing protein